MKQHNYRTAFAFLTLLFFMWGFITVLVDALVPRLKAVFELSYGQSIMVQFAFFGAFFCFSIPASYLLERIGYQRGMVTGLVIMGLSCLFFYPAASYREFWMFITGFFGLATGITLLQVAANPYVTLLGDEKNAAKRLNLSQAFNSFGTLLAPIAGALFLLSDSIKDSNQIQSMSLNQQQLYYSSEALTVQQPFIIIAGLLFALALLFGLIKLPAFEQTTPKDGYLKLLQNKKFVLGVIAIFMYVGAEVSIGSFLVNYFEELELYDTLKRSSLASSIASLLLMGKNISELEPRAILGSFVTLYWGAAMLGRFIGAYLMNFIASSRLLFVFGLGAMLCIALSVHYDGLIAMSSILAVGLFNSIMFPTIFSNSLKGIDALKVQGSGILVMAIVGGAIIPKIVGTLADIINPSFTTSIGGAFLCLLICYAFISYFGYRSDRK
jgi:FHS family L-fucose permease-like MFS transporter